MATARAPARSWSALVPQQRDEFTPFNSVPPPVAAISATPSTINQGYAAARKSNSSNNVNINRNYAEKYSSLSQSIVAVPVPQAVNTNNLSITKASTTQMKNMTIPTHKTNVKQLYFNGLEKKRQDNIKLKEEQRKLAAKQWLVETKAKFNHMDSSTTRRIALEKEANLKETEAIKRKDEAINKTLLELDAQRDYNIHCRQVIRQYCEKDMIAQSHLQKMEQEQQLLVEAQLKAIKKKQAAKDAELAEQQKEQIKQLELKRQNNIDRITLEQQIKNAQWYEHWQLLQQQKEQEHMLKHVLRERSRVPTIQASF